jgi:hypothetical protein
MKTFIVDAYLRNGTMLPEHTFGLTVIDAVRYREHRDQCGMYDWALCDRVFRAWGFDYLTPDHVPVGGLGFVLAWLSRMGVATVTPLNIPVTLWGDCRRDVVIGSAEALSGEYMSKSISCLKDPQNGPVRCPTPQFGRAERFFTRWVADVIAEWRCFVHRGTLVGLQNYAGDPFVVPNRAYIENVIGHYPKRAYTLDVMVYPDSHGRLVTDIVELHDFFACELFGFSDYDHLLSMHVDAMADQLMTASGAVSTNDGETAPPTPPIYL